MRSSSGGGVATDTVLTPDIVHDRAAPWVRSQSRYFARAFGLSADEVEQTAWLLICKCVHTFDANQSALTTWLARSVRFAAFRLVRNRRRLTGPLPANPDGSECDFPGREIDPADAVVRAETTAAVEASIGELADPLRDTIRGRLDGHTLQALGNRAGLTRERIRQRESKAIAQLRRSLGVSS